MSRAGTGSVRGRKKSGDGGRTTVGITVVGPDRGGVVATFTNHVFQAGGNVEKVNQNVIRGLFGMYLEASFAAGEVDIAGFDRGLRRLARSSGMDVSTHHESGSRKNIAVFVTKESGCLEEILKNRSGIGGRVAVVVGTEGTLRPVAKKAGVPFVVVREKVQAEAEARLIRICGRYKIDLILLARYMRILTPNFVWRYPNRIINIHPSLLPAFPGAIAYAQAFERGTKIVGVTAHYVTENLDQGPIILQDAFAVGQGDTLESIKKRGQQLEAATLYRAAELHLGGRLEVSWTKVLVRPSGG